MRFAVVVVVVTIGCSSKLAQPDGHVQDACSFTAYRAPGCGQAAVPESLECGGIDSGCESIVCSCDGQTISAPCRYSLVPFASSGPCEYGPTDGPRDTSPDGPTYPRCSFIEATPAGAQCNVAACIDPVDVGADANHLGCGTCADGYACAVYCPTPLGGCGAPYRCCPTH